jgi:hypothetical protein
MALITDYTSLKDALEAFQDRTDVPVDQAIQLAEARLNRVLKGVETDATLTGVVGSRSLDITSQNVVYPIALFLNDPTRNTEIELVQRVDGSFPYASIAGYPSNWAIDGTNIDLNCLLDQAYTFRLRYVGRLGLSDANPTNELLTNHPDIYICAAIVWGGLFVADDGIIARYGNPLNQFLAERKRIEEENRRGKLTVDPALAIVGRYRDYWGRYGW